MDFNFDGFNDISIIAVAGTSNTLSNIYLFDPSSKMFVKENTLSQYASLQVDAVNHVLTFHNARGMGGGWYPSGVIQWTQRQPVIIRREEQSSSEEEPEAFIRKIQLRMENGEMKTVCKVRIERIDTNKEKQCLLEGDWIEFDKYPFSILQRIWIAL